MISVVVFSISETADTIDSSVFAVARGVSVLTIVSGVLVVRS